MDYSYEERISFGYHTRLGALSLILYDYFLTLDDELELFWKWPWTLTTYLFLWTRYGGIAFLVILLCLFTKTSNPEHTCITSYLVEVILGTINTCVIEFVLVLRLYALYNCSRCFAHAAGFTFGLQVLFLFSFSAYTLPKSLKFLDADVVNGFIYCEINNYHMIDNFWLYWIPFILFEVLVFSLTVRQALQYYRLNIRLTNLISTLLWDSIAYTFLTTLFYFLNIALDRVNRENYDTVSGLGLTLPIVMGGRMMRNVRRTFSNDQYRRVPASPSDISLHIVEQPRGLPVVLRYV